MTVTSTSSYVKNLYNGNGLTYNGEKMQGFTSTFWMLLLIIAGLLPWELPKVAETLSGISGLFTIVATYIVGRRLGLSRSKALVAPLMLAGTWDFVFYMGSALEAVFFSGMLLLTTGIIVTKDAQSLARSFSVPLLVAATVLTRPEGIIVAGIVFIYLVINKKNPAGRRHHVQSRGHPVAVLHRTARLLRILAAEHLLM